MNNTGSKQLTEKREIQYITSNHQIIIQSFCLIGKIGKILSFTKLCANCSMNNSDGACR